MILSPDEQAYHYTEVRQQVDQGAGCHLLLPHHIKRLNWNHSETVYSFGYPSSMLVPCTR
ncbi:hypothetical protein O9993_17335 [Vibrio lentus]|nr:hypothetical protein [Vibrio lentus]